MILRCQGKTFPIRSPAFATLLLDLLEEEHVGPVASHMSLGILLQLRVNLLEILIAIATLFSSAFSRAEPVQHFRNHLPHARMILAIRLEGALYALRLDDIKQRHRLRNIEVTLRGSRRTLMVIAARNGRGRLGLLRKGTLD